MSRIMIKKIGKHLFAASLTLLALIGAVDLIRMGGIALLYPKHEASAARQANLYEIAGETLEERYLGLMKKCLTRYELVREHERVGLLPLFDGFLWDRSIALMRILPSDDKARIDGRVAKSTEAETMIGLKRLDNLETCILDVLQRDIPGDLIEAGAWRGGATIFMRAVLLAYRDPARIVWVADSFEGLPKPDTNAYPADAGDVHWTYDHLAVSLQQVQQNFARYGLLDDRVRFLKGWFKDTLPSAPIEKLAVLRVDADMYGSTTEALRYLYPKLSPGGYVIVDDYGAVPGCRKAVEDFRAEHGITDEIMKIDWTGVYWQKSPT